MEAPLQETFPRALRDLEDKLVDIKRQVELLESQLQFESDLQQRIQRQMNNLLDSLLASHQYSGRQADRVTDLACEVRRLRDMEGPTASSGSPAQARSTEAGSSQARSGP
ncbi:hypothetical protein CBOM_01242 [Ceraceosorus bombacis]|uniref:Uncharacterized protein n=1 Tax=Ceraceosorus bombacis TaxID=401625 RepID=A0A0P1BC42_9BASI|nr:hypothetical protein CBOM_01242 [Ceraceosorus bombacis]